MQTVNGGLLVRITRNNPVPHWRKWRKYHFGNYAYVAGYPKIYRCIAENVATEENKPETGSGWEEFWEVVAEVTVHFTGVHYNEGDVVIIDSIPSGVAVFVCLQEHTATDQTAPLTGDDWRQYWSREFFWSQTDFSVRQIAGGEATYLRTKFSDLSEFIENGQAVDKLIDAIRVEIGEHDTDESVEDGSWCRLLGGEAYDFVVPTMFPGLQLWVGVKRRLKDEPTWYGPVLLDEPTPPEELTSEHMILDDWPFVSYSESLELPKLSKRFLDTVMPIVERPHEARYVSLKIVAPGPNRRWQFTAIELFGSVRRGRR